MTLIEVHTGIADGRDFYFSASEFHPHGEVLAVIGAFATEDDAIAAAYNWAIENDCLVLEVNP